MVDLDCFYENSARYKRTSGVIALTAVWVLGLERTGFGGRPRAGDCRGGRDGLSVKFLRMRPPNPSLSALLFYDYHFMVI